MGIGSNSCKHGWVFWVPKHKGKVVDSITIRPITKNDASALVAFYNCLSAASIRIFRPLGEKTSLDICQQIVNENILPPSKRFDLVCCHGTKLVGWAFIANLDEGCPKLGIAVADSLQGKGVGKTLLGQLLGWAKEKEIKKVFLIVVTDNQRAIHLYKSHGFVIHDEKFNETDQLPYFHMAANLASEA